MSLPIGPGSPALDSGLALPPACIQEPEQDAGSYVFRILWLRLRRRLQLEIDHDAPHGARLASKDMALLFIIGRECVSAILLDRAFQKGDLAGTALTGAA